MRSRQTAASVIYILNEVPIAGGWALRDSLWSNSTTRRSKRALVFHSKVILHHRASVLSCALLASIALLPLSPLLLSTRGIEHPILFVTLLKVHTLAALTPAPLLPLTPVLLLALTPVPDTCRKARAQSAQAANMGRRNQQPKQW